MSTPDHADVSRKTLLAMRIDLFDTDLKGRPVYLSNFSGAELVELNSDGDEEGCEATDALLALYRGAHEYTLGGGAAAEFIVCRAGNVPAPREVEVGGVS